MTSPPAKIDPVEQALFLDVDGTLLDIREHPHAVSADAGLVTTLRHTCHSMGGAMALISGRGLSDIDRIFGPTRFSAAGAHGSEIRLGNTLLETAEADDVPGDVVDALHRFVDANDGLLLERKATGVSLHYRRAPELESACRAIVADILGDLGPDFRLIDGKMVLEIAPRAHTKGEAIRTFLEYEPFHGRRPVFIGDDVTDEDGFIAANDLGGLSIRVGEIETSEARYSLDGVPAVHRWLAGILGP
jgi:trehalose 6-phosphate phosphatase